MRLEAAFIMGFAALLCGGALADQPPPPAIDRAGLAEAREAPPGALACSGCHGAGASLSLAGLSAAEISGAMAAFRSGAREATVMNRIAAGFDDAELAAIAGWIAEGD